MSSRKGEEMMREDDVPEPLICMCETPVREWIALFRTWQCSRCERKWVRPIINS